MDAPIPADNSAFRRWTEVTDAFAREFQSLQSGNKAALAEVRRLSGELQRIGKEMGQDVRHIPTAGVDTAK